MTSGRGLFHLYQNGGIEFLGYKLERLFSKIENESDVALHNDIVQDVMLIIGTGEEVNLVRKMADFILYPKVNKRKRFLFRVAEQILNIGRKKG